MFIEYIILKIVIVHIHTYIHTYIYIYMKIITLWSVPLFNDFNVQKSSLGPFEEWVKEGKKSCA